MFSMNSGGFLPNQPDDASFIDSVVKDNNHVCPMCASFLTRAFLADPSMLTFDFCGDTSIRKVHLVGLVLDLTVDEAVGKWSFYLDDGTGKVFVEWALQDNQAGCSPWETRRLQRIVNCTYVEVVGEINTLVRGNRPAIRAFCIKGVVVFERVFVHKLHVAQEILQRIPISPKPASSLKPSQPRIVEFIAKPAGPTDAAIQSAILEVLKDRVGEEEGVAEAELRGHLRATFKGLKLDLAAIRRLCECLASSGQAHQQAQGTWAYAEF